MSKSFIVTDDEMKPDSCYECGAEKKWLVLKHGDTPDADAWWECVVCEHKFPVVRLFDISEEAPPVFDFEEDDLEEWEYDLLNAEDEQQPDDDESAGQLRLF